MEVLLYFAVSFTGKVHLLMNEVLSFRTQFYIFGQQCVHERQLKIQYAWT